MVNLPSDVTSQPATGRVTASASEPVARQTSGANVDLGAASTRGPVLTAPVSGQGDGATPAVDAVAPAEADAGSPAAQATMTQKLVGTATGGAASTSPAASAGSMIVPVAGDYDGRAQ